LETAHGLLGWSFLQNFRLHALSCGDNAQLDFDLEELSPTRNFVIDSRVKVPAGRYVVPTGKDNVIVSAGRTKVIPAGSTILVLRVLRKQGVRVSCVFKKPTALDEGTD
ncbi:hypothetical protein Tco_0096187, partial [Tanacetum coccineum]